MYVGIGRYVGNNNTKNCKFQSEMIWIKSGYPAV